MLLKLSVAVLSLFILGSGSVIAQEESPARQQFLAAWSKRTVVLKKPMYSIAYDGPTGQAITAVSPDKGSYFQIELITDTGRGLRVSPPILDRDPVQLVNKIAAELGQRATPKLLTFKASTSFKATARFIDEPRNGRTRLAFDLYDDLDEENKATILWVHWPTAWSADFSERSAVEKLIAEYFRP